MGSSPYRTRSGRCGCPKSRSGWFDGQETTDLGGKEHRKCSRRHVFHAVLNVAPRALVREPAQQFPQIADQIQTSIVLCALEMDRPRLPIGCLWASQAPISKRSGFVQQFMRQICQNENCWLIADLRQRTQVVIRLHDYLEPGFFCRINRSDYDLLKSQNRSLVSCCTIHEHYVAFASNFPDLYATF